MGLGIILELEIKTSTQLAGLYLAVMMAISLFFSFNVYQLSVQEFDRGFRGQDTILRRGSDFRSAPITRNQLIQNQKLHYEQAKGRVLNRLIIINAFILIGGGFLSYYLARRTLDPIEEAHRSLERFTADASHELRTPLAVMQTEIEVSLMDPRLTFSQAKSQLKSNLEELAKLTSLSEGLLRLAHLGNNSISLLALDVNMFIDKAINRVLPYAQKKQILIKNTAVNGLKVLGDEDNLTEALVILLDNAVKYSPSKTEITVTTAKDQNQVTIKVKDHGNGIIATDLPHIFDRFFRADSSRSKQTTKGYGLGLAIAKNIIVQHSGTIAATSRPDKGSTFIVHLPLA